MRTYGDAPKPRRSLSNLVFGHHHRRQRVAHRPTAHQTPPTRALDPAKFFIIVPALFGNGELGDAKDDVRWLDDKIYRLFLKHGIVQ